MKKRLRFLLWSTCISGIFLTVLAAWTVSRMITGAIPVQASRIGAMIVAFVSYMSLCAQLYLCWKEQKSSK